MDNCDKLKLSIKILYNLKDVLCEDFRRIKLVIDNDLNPLFEKNNLLDDDLKIASHKILKLILIYLAEDVRESIRASAAILVN